VGQDKYHKGLNLLLLIVFPVHQTGVLTQQLEGNYRNQDVFFVMQHVMVLEEVQPVG
jgi:hypothetical protein